MKLKCNLLSIDGKLYEGEVESTVVQAYDGEMGFLHNHAPLIAELGIGELRLNNAGTTKYFVVEGGFVHVRDNEITILADRTFSKERLVKNDLEESLKNIKANLKEEKDLDKKMKLEVELKRMKARLKVVSRGN